MSALDPPIYGHVLIGRRGTATLFSAAYLATGGAAASSVDQRRLGGGAPWLRWRLTGHGLYPCQGGRVPVGVSLKRSGQVGDPYPQSCRDQDGPGEGLRRWPVFFALWRRRELGLAVLWGRALANRVRRRHLMLVVELVWLERDAPVWRLQGQRARVQKLGGQNFDQCQLLL
jgi:hypothetical protein